MSFFRRHLLFVCRRPSRKLLGENCWGSRQLRMLTWFSVIWSLFQYLVIFDICLVKKIKTYRVYHALQYSRQTCEILRARDCDLFPTIYLISLSENYSKTIEGNWQGSCQLRMLTWFSLIWSQFQFLVTIDYFWVKNIMLYASTQPKESC